MTSRPVCERCGSIRITPNNGGSFDKIIDVVSRRQRFRCLRCGWEARRAWPVDLTNGNDVVADRADSYDPTMIALDEDFGDLSVNKERKKRRRRPQPARRFNDFDLAALKRQEDENEVSDSTDLVPQPKLRSRRGAKRRRGRRREILGAMAIAAAVLSLVAILGLSGSCHEQISRVSPVRQQTPSARIANRVITNSM